MAATRLLRVKRLLFAFVLLAALSLSARTERPARSADQATTAGPARLVKDINPTNDLALGSQPHSFTTLGNAVYFVADDQRHGHAVWRTDGTAAGTWMLKDLTPGARSAVDGPLFMPWATRNGWVATSLFAVNGRLYMTVQSNDFQYEVWSSDGTVAGTVRLKRMGTAFGVTGAALGTASALLALYDPASGYELWRSDGTPAGTVLVKDIAPGATSSTPRELTSFGDVVYFIAGDPSSSVGLWKSDGTAEGTLLVKDGFPGTSAAGTSVPNSLLNANGTLYFAADDGSHGCELWKSDGTAQGTHMILDLAPGTEPGLYQCSLHAGYLNGSLYFSGHVEGRLWRTDGTAAGTRPVDPYSATGSFRSFVVVNNLLFLSSEYALWRSDGTAEGTTALIDYREATSYAVLNGRVVFITERTFQSSSKTELWITDGTRGGTELLSVADNPYDHWRTGLAVLADRVVFAGHDPVHGNELWRSDGTVAGTVLLNDIGQAPRGSAIGAMQSYNNRLVFRANDGVTGNELWISDGTSHGTQLLADITPGAGGTDLANFVQFGGLLFFTARSNCCERSLWRTDGTPAGTYALGISSLAEYNALIRTNTTLYFVTYNYNDYSKILWRTDGSREGSVQLAEMQDFSYLTTAGDKLYFVTREQLWVSDGTVQGTFPLTTAQINPLHDFGLEPLGNALLFGNNGDLWRTDGTPQGTRLVKADAAGEKVRLGTLDGSLFYVRILYAGLCCQYELWKSDGTAAGTVKLRQLSGGASCGRGGPCEIFPLINLEDELFFQIQYGRDAYWRTDGTEAGTMLINPMPPGTWHLLDNRLLIAGREGLYETQGTSSTTSLIADVDGSAEWRTTPIAINDTLIFAGAAPRSDRSQYLADLWISRGTAETTLPVHDILPGPGGSVPRHFSVVGPNVFFEADDGSHGSELWVMPVPYLPYRNHTLGLSLTIQAEDFNHGGEGISYHDTDLPNWGSYYRLDQSVDIQRASNETGDTMVAYTWAGEWLEYRVDVVASDIYTVGLRVGALGPGGTFHIEIDGRDVTGALQVPDTGGWWNLELLQGPGIFLGAGQHMLRLVLDSNGETYGVGNFDLIRLDRPAAVQEHLPLLRR